MITIGLVERYPAICIGLRTYLEERFEGVSIISSPRVQEMVGNHSTIKLDVLILGIYGSLESLRLATISLCQKHFPSVPIVGYGDDADPMFILESLKLGLRGFVLKEDGLDEVELCINAVLDGKHYLNPSTTELFLNHLSQSRESRVSNLSPLSEKEKIIAGHLVKGMRPRDIARKLNLKPSTVSTFKRMIFKKTLVENVLDLKTFLEVEVI